MRLLPKSEFSNRGSAPLELVGFLALLMLPIAPMLVLFGQISDQLAAESIARHGLRYAFLASELASDPSALVGQALQSLAQSWGKELGDFEVFCGPCGPGGVVNLRVQVGSATAIQSAGLEPE